MQKRRVDLSTVVEEGRKPVEMSGEWRFWKKEYWSDFKFIKPTINATVILSALSIMMLNVGANISFGGITASIAGTRQNFDHLSIINSLADVPSAIFGGPPIEAIISGTAGAPWPVACGIVFMIAMAVLILTGLVGAAGPLPARAEHIGLPAGDRLCADLRAQPRHRRRVRQFHERLHRAGRYRMVSKNPFLGMVVGVLVRYLGVYVGLV